MREEIIIKLYNEIRSQMICLEQLRNTIWKTKDEYFGSKKMKDKLLQVLNNILSEYLVFYDLLNQILNAVDHAKIQAIIDEYELVEEDE